MADSMEARREARRRKILQNSENRLNRLLGNPSTDNDENAAQTRAEIPEADESTSSSSASSLRETAAASQQTSSSTEDHSTTETEEASAAAEGGPLFKDSTLRQRTLGTGSAPAGPRIPPAAPSANIASEGVLSAASDVPSAARSVPSSTWNAPSFGASAPSRGTGHSPGQAARRGDRSGVGEERVGMTGGDSGLAADPARLLNLLRCGGCVLAAVLTRWALACGLALVFCELVLVPFVLVEGFLFYFQATHMKDVQMAHKATMVTYALMLSGMKQEIITRYNGIMGYIRLVSEDFAVFLFTFLLCHAVMG